MSIHDLVADDQPDKFAFSSENEALIKKIIAKYPEGKQASAVMPLLDLAQRQHDNWIPMAAIEAIASPGSPGAFLRLPHKAKPTPSPRTATVRPDEATMAPKSSAMTSRTDRFNVPCLKIL